MKPDPKDHAFDHPLPTQAGSYVVQPDNALLQVEAATQSPDPNAPDAYSEKVEALTFVEVEAKHSEWLETEQTDQRSAAKPGKAKPVDLPADLQAGAVLTQKKEA